MLMFTVFLLFVGFCVCSEQSIEIPVKSRHELKVIPVSSSGEEHVTHVEVDGGVLPVYMLFKTESSPLYVKQLHRGVKGSFQKSNSKDEPHQLVHEVVKPVIQELNEFITPVRKVMQVIQPVEEEKLTMVHKGEGKMLGYVNNAGYDQSSGVVGNIGIGKLDEGINSYGKSLPLIGDIGYGKLDDSSLGYKGLESGMVGTAQEIGQKGQLTQIDGNYNKGLYGNRLQDIQRYDNNQDIGLKVYEQSGNQGINGGNQGIIEGNQGILNNGYSQIELNQLCKSYRTMTLADLIKKS